MLAIPSWGIMVEYSWVLVNVNLVITHCSCLVILKLDWIEALLWEGYCIILFLINIAGRGHQEKAEGDWGRSYCHFWNARQDWEWNGHCPRFDSFAYESFQVNWYS